MFGVVLIMAVFLTVIFLPPSLIPMDVLSYSSVQSIYGEKVRIQYNSRYPSDDQENLIVNSIVSSQDGYIEATSQEWDKPSVESYTNFFTEISNGLDDDMAAYWVDAVQSDNVWDINAVIFANATSPASVPTFGNLLL